MNVSILKEEGYPSYITGGGCAVSTLEIIVDPSLPDSIQKEIIIHEVIEGFLPCLPHDKIDELTEMLIKALEEGQNARPRIVV